MILHVLPRSHHEIMTSGQNTMYFKERTHFESDTMIKKSGQASLNAKMRNSAAQSANLAGSIACSVFTSSNSFHDYVFSRFGVFHRISYLKVKKKHLINLCIPAIHKTGVKNFEPSNSICSVDLNTAKMHHLFSPRGRKAYLTDLAKCHMPRFDVGQRDSFFSTFDLSDTFLGGL